MSQATRENTTVCVITYMCDEDLEGLLQPLCEQSDQIVVVDGASSFETEKLCENFNVSYFASAENNIGLNRKRAVEIAQTEYIAFIDTDCRPDKNWLGDLIELFNSQKEKYERLAGVGGGQEFFGHFMCDLANFVIGPRLTFGSPQGNFNTVRSVDHLATFNALFEKRAIIQAGQFSENFVRVGEDLDLGRRLVNNGFTLLSHTYPKVRHRWRGSWFEKVYGYGKAQSRVAIEGRPLRYWLGLALLPMTVVFFFCPWVPYLSVVYLLAIGWLFKWEGGRGVGNLLVVPFFIAATFLLYSAGQYRGLLPDLRVSSK